MRGRRSAPSDACWETAGYLGAPGEQLPVGAAHEDDGVPGHEQLGVD